MRAGLLHQDSIFFCASRTLGWASLFTLILGTRQGSIQCRSHSPPRDQGGVDSLPIYTSLSISTQNTHHKLILSLFTDNATVFLSQNNCPKTLFEILNMWCLVSGTKFNKEKTIILPVGTTDYRENVIINKTLQLDGPQTLPDSIQILKDGESTRCLSAQIGNQIKGNEPWPKIIEDIENSL